jgi:uncharacterized protein (TIGR01777 family)
MKWLLAGASGFLGQALRVRLASEGHEVTRLVRRKPATSTEFGWDPDRGEIDSAALDGVEAVVNFGGVGVFNAPWTEQRREGILSSRVHTTQTVAEAIAARPEGKRPVLIQGSGIARYGIVANAEPFTEDDLAAADFLAQVTVQWEGAARAATEAGARTVFLRTSPVMDRSGGAFAPMKLAWSAGLGAIIGTGEQHMPMISLDDYLGVVQWAADTPHAAGPYNLTLPVPTTNAEFTDELARQLHRPRVLKVPAAVLRTTLGELSGQVLGDIYAVPERLQADGYRFYYPDVSATVAAALRREPAA